MIRPLPVLTGSLAALLAAGATAPTPGRGQAELVVRNESFSTLAIAVVEAERREAVIGQAPPEFTNTLYVPVDDPAVRLRFRARLRGSTEILHESEVVPVREGTKLRWTLPDNVLETVRAREAAADGVDGERDPSTGDSAAARPSSGPRRETSRG